VLHRTTSNSIDSADAAGRRLDYVDSACCLIWLSPRVLTRARESSQGHHLIFRLSPERAHPRAGLLDEDSRSHDTHPMTRTKVSDVVRGEEACSCADRCGEIETSFASATPRARSRSCAVGWWISTETARRNYSKSGAASGSLAARFRRTSVTAASGTTRRRSPSSPRTRIFRPIRADAQISGGTSAIQSVVAHILWKSQDGLSARPGQYFGDQSRSRRCAEFVEYVLEVLFHG